MKSPTPRQASWYQNLARSRPADANEGDDMAIDPSPATRDKSEVSPYQGNALRAIQLKADQQLAKGGPVRSVAGGRRGKDDGLIGAKRGEFVVRKKAARKYGQNALMAVNEGRARIAVPNKERKSS